MLITFKNPKNLLFLIITPFLLSLFLYALQSLSVKNGNFVIPDPPSELLPPFSECSWSDCTSLQVSFISNNSNADFTSYPWINSVLGSVEGATGVSATRRPSPITSFADLQNYYTEIEQAPNKTQIGLLMCGDTS